MASSSLFEGAIEVWRQRYDGVKFTGATCLLRNMQRRQCHEALQLLDDDQKLALAKKFFSDDKIAELQAQAAAELLKTQRHGTTTKEKQRHFIEYALYLEKPKVGLLSTVGGFLRMLPLGLTFLYGLTPFALSIYLARFLLDPIMKALHRVSSTDETPFPMHCLPSEMLQALISHFIIGMLGLELDIRGADHMRAARDGEFGKNRRLIGLYNHCSNADPFCVQSSGFSLMCWTWVAKKELFYVPGIGLFMNACGHYPIDRKRHEQAVRNMRLANEQKKPPMVAPEGTRQVSGLVAPDLKKGCFHTQAEQNAVFVPIVLLGAYERWPRKQIFCTMGKVRCCYLKPIDVGKPDGTKGMDEARELVRQKLIQGVAQDLEKDEENATLEKVSMAFWVKHIFVWWPLFFLSQYMCWSMLIFARSTILYLMPAGIF